MNLPTRIKKIAQTIQELTTKDVNRSTFGANGHEYNLNPVLSELDLAIFESANQLELPKDYRAFLSQIGNGGTGPFYGLYSLEKGLEEATYYSTEDDTPIAAAVTQNFPVSKKEVEKFIQYYNNCIEDGEDESIEYLDVPDPLTGTIFLSEYGCGWSYLLVVKGELAGSIWMHGDYFCPLFVDNHLWTFADWYEDWLERSLADLDSKPEKTAFDPNQTILNYDGWKLKEIPEEVFECKNLKKLVFSRNDLAEFPKKVVQFEQLTTLDLSMTPIVEIPEEIGNIKKLKKLFLNYNYHTTLPTSLSKLPLQELSMFHSYKLESIPDVVTSIKTLKILHVAHCGELRKVPSNIGNLVHLKQFNLNDCDKLTELPESITQLKNLHFLYLDYTKIPHLPNHFEQLQNLEALGISIHNLDLEKVVEQIKNLPNLYWLRIFSEFDYPSNFSELKHITNLVITENYSLQNSDGSDTLALPENLTLLPNLESLDLSSNNQINQLPESIDRLKSLKRLYIGSTKIQRFPESMKRLSNIELIQGNRNRDLSSPFGVLPEEREKLIQWFPNAKIEI